MIIVGIDPSLTSAGIAILRDGRPVMLTSVGYSDGNAKSWEQRSKRVWTQANRITDTIKAKIGLPDLAVIEAPLTVEGPGTGQSYDRYTVFILVCIILNDWRVPYAVVHNQTRSKWATGRGGSKKKEVVAAVRATWKPWKAHIANDDIADALTLAEAGARRCAEPLHFPPRRRHIEALPGIHWPTIQCAKPETTQVGASR